MDLSVAAPKRPGPGGGGTVNGDEMTASPAKCSRFEKVIPAGPVEPPVDISGGGGVPQLVIATAGVLPGSDGNGMAVTVAEVEDHGGLGLDLSLTPQGLVDVDVAMSAMPVLDKYNESPITERQIMIEHLEPSQKSPEGIEPGLDEVMDLSAPTVNKSENGTEDRRSRGEKRKAEEDDVPVISFIQDGPCYKVAPWIREKCRECQDIVSIKKNVDIVCRFASFRKLVYQNGAKVASGPVFEGFANPDVDPTFEDRSLWLPQKKNPPKSLELDLCKNLIAQLGDQFCALIRQEKEAVDINCELQNRQKAWKKIVEGVREMCDVCATTIFNYHWSCNKCGFMVCIDCFKAKQNNIVKGKLEKDPEKDEFHWMRCRNQDHQVKDMWLTQIIPGAVLDEISEILHEVRWEWNIPQLCGCVVAAICLGRANENATKAVNNTIPTIKEVERQAESTEKPEKQHKCEDEDATTEDSSDEDEEELLMLKSLTKKTPEKVKELDCQNENKDVISVETLNVSLPKNDRAQLPTKISTLTQSKLLYPNLPHMWLCNGTLLRILDPSYEQNYDLFRDLWKRGQPVLVSKVADKLDKHLWSPRTFSEDFGKQRNDLVNCMTGKVVPGQRMKHFWEGFIDVSKRLKDEDGTPMLLKLKDWPPGDDFAKMMPSRFKDLMAALPLKDYTHRTGRLNLAARLPDKFIKPDLGPKMYIAYGDGNHLEKGTTNLHLDISDAVNCMVYVGVPTNCDVVKHNKAVMDAIESSDCDKLTIRRVTEGKELPGALWHIYRPWDADKIRDLLNKVIVENKKAIEANNDPIHDQVAYLDEGLRKRLRLEYNVLGFPIVQCEGDAVFIPAGAPHQVRNLHNCIKIAEDFVSPENVSHCFQLTEEFRNLSDTHTNHEDKLQIKNIVYHAVKDALSVLLNASKTK